MVNRMKLVQVAEQNKKYYTKEFIHGFNTGAKVQYEEDKRYTERWGRSCASDLPEMGKEDAGW